MSSNEEVTVELLPCPFCGRAPIGPVEQGSGQWRVFCCGFYREAPARHLVAAAWNTRAAKPTPDAGLVERFIEAATELRERIGAASLSKAGKPIRDKFDEALTALREHSRGDALTRPITMQVDNEWLRRKIESDPDLPCEAGTQ